MEQVAKSREHPCTKLQHFNFFSFISLLKNCSLRVLFMYARGYTSHDFDYTVMSKVRTFDLKSSEFTDVIPPRQRRRTKRVNKVNIYMKCKSVYDWQTLV